MTTNREAGARGTEQHRGLPVLDSTPTYGFTATATVKVKDGVVPAIVQSA